MTGSFLIVEYGCIVVLSVCEALCGSGLSGLCFSFLSSSSFLQLLSHIMADSYGIRTFWDLQQKQERHDQEEWQKSMAQLEMRVSQIDEYRNIAFFHHLIFVRE